MNFCIKIFNWITFQLSLSKKTSLYKIAYFDGMLSQPMPYESAVWPAKVFGGIIVPVKREIN